MYHTAKWPHHDVGFTGKRVGIIGTGSSGVQSATAIAKADVEQLYVFQRTPNYRIPARNSKMDPEYEREWKARYDDHRARALDSGFGLSFDAPPGLAADLSEDERLARMEAAWEIGGPAVLAVFPDLLVDWDVNRWVADYIRAQLQRDVADAQLADTLCQKSHVVGARRLIVEDGYLEIYSQPNVALVDLRGDPILEVTPRGVRTASREYALDILILATGFDSGSGPMLRMDFKGMDGISLGQHWSDGPRTFLGLVIDKFPNMFMIWGPGSPGVRSQGILMGELQVDWIVTLLQYMERNGLRCVQPSARAANEWTAHVAETADKGLFAKDESHYVGSNVPGKPRVYTAYLGGVKTYRSILADVRDQDYVGLSFDGAPAVAPVERDWTRDRVDVVRVMAI